MITLESDDLLVEVAPEVGGRIVRFVAKRSGYDFLWHNSRVPLRREEPGAEYDPNFFGGIDELIPNDIPETIDGVDCPDHGELWTTEHQWEQVSGRELVMSCLLPRFGLELTRRLTVDGNKCLIQAVVRNLSGEARHLLWKLHPALAIEPGDLIECLAASYEAVDPKWSRRQGSGPWEGETVPAFDGTTEFLYLLEPRGRMSWHRGGKRFEIEFDPSVFRYALYFASYGGFYGHHFAILEPCTAKPISVKEAAELGQCLTLQPEQTVGTFYSYRGFDED